MKSKVTFISDVTTPERVYLNVPEFKYFDLKFFTTLDGEEKIIKEVPDTEFLIVDAMSKVTEKLVDSLPNLKLIQSEGVGYQGIDVDAATRRNIPVCNNKGINDTAVAEVAVFLILGCLKKYNDGIAAMYDGKQIEKKGRKFRCYQRTFRMYGRTCRLWRYCKANRNAPQGFRCKGYLLQPHKI